MKKTYEDQLFPDEAREADRNKFHKKQARKVGARMRLEESTTDMQEFILRVFREHGPGDTFHHIAELDELCGGIESEAIGPAWGNFWRTLIDMHTVGILWCHKWSEDEWTWGIRGVHSKAKMLREVREEEKALEEQAQEKRRAHREEMQAAKN